MGVDPAQLAASTGVEATPGMLDHLLTQLRALMAQSDGEDVNWSLAHDVARGVAAQGGDPTVSAAIAAEHRAAVTTAELWLDAATDFAPSTLVPHVWSHAEWVEATLPTWRFLAGPVAVSVSRALGGLLRREAGEESDGTNGGMLLGQISPTVCGMHVGQAAGAMAREAFGGTDLGLPLLSEPQVALVPRSISEFAEGLDVPADEVRAFLALREAAHVRLFKRAPWLHGQLHTAIERYAAGVTIDLDALDSAVGASEHGRSRAAAGGAQSRDLREHPYRGPASDARGDRDDARPRRGLGRRRDGAGRRAPPPSSRSAAGDDAPQARRGRARGTHVRDAPRPRVATAPLARRGGYVGRPPRRRGLGRAGRRLDSPGSPPRAGRTRRLDVVGRGPRAPPLMATRSIANFARCSATAPEGPDSA